MPRPKNPSKRFKRDPTNSQRRINAYERELVKLFKNYQERIVRDLKQMNERFLESKNPVSIPPKTAGEELTKAGKEEVIDPGKKVIGKKIPESYRAGGKFADTQLGVSFGGSLAERQAEWKKIAALIEKNEIALEKVTAEIVEKIRQLIADGVIKEKTLWDMMEDIYKASDVGITRARTIARTEIMAGVNEGIKDRYKAAGVEKGEWLAAADDIVCPDCEDLDGKQFPLDSFPDCPGHPQCRCSILPVIEIPEEDWT